jgi:hypothetical protein
VIWPKVHDCASWNGPPNTGKRDGANYPRQTRLSGGTYPSPRTGPATFPVRRMNGVSSGASRSLWRPARSTRPPSKWTCSTMTSTCSPRKVRAAPVSSTVAAPTGLSPSACSTGFSGSDEPARWKWPGLLSSARSFGFNHYVHALEQSRLLYVHALVLRKALIKPSGVSFVRWTKRDALPLAVTQLELIPHVVFVRTFAHVAAAFLPTALWTCLRGLRSAMTPTSIVCRMHSTGSEDDRDCG